MPVKQRDVNSLLVQYVKLEKKNILYNKTYPKNDDCEWYLFTERSFKRQF